MEASAADPFLKRRNEGNAPASEGHSIRRAGMERKGNTPRRREKRRGDAGHVAGGGEGGQVTWTTPGDQNTES